MMKHLFFTIFMIIQIKGTMLVNRVLYYLKRFPIIGKKIPDKAYDLRDIKLMVTILSILIFISRHFFTKTFYVLVATLLPMFLVIEDLPPELAGMAFANILVFLSLFFGSFKGSKALDSTVDKFNSFKLMHMPGKDFALATFLMTHLSELIGFTPVILITGTLLGIGFLNALSLLLLILGCHIIGEAFYLLVLDKTKKYIGESIFIQVPLSLLALALAYVPIFTLAIPGFTFSTNFVSSTYHFVFSLPFVLGILALAALSLYYQLTYKHYGWAMQTSLNMETLSKVTNLKKTKSEARFKDVNLNEKDLVTNFDSSKINHKKGYVYLNALFFERHKRILLKPVIVIVGSILIGTLLYSILGLFAKDISQELSKSLITRLTFFVFLMYFLTVFSGERACRAMFNNCDISLLRYGFYRNPRTILENFKIRLVMLGKLNLMISGALCLFVILGTYFSGIHWPLVDELLFLLCIILLGLFFSVHHLFLYYVFQPYTTDLEMKNPFFKFISGAVYILCYSCLYLKVSSQVFTFIVLGATIVYISVALILVYKLAPKNFRVK